MLQAKDKIMTLKVHIFLSQIVKEDSKFHLEKNNLKCYLISKMDHTLNNGNFNLVNIAQLQIFIIFGLWVWDIYLSERTFV